MKPKILITPNIVDTLFTVNRAYVHAIKSCGGVPILSTYEDRSDLDDLLDCVDGVLLTGGGDIDSKYFHQPLHPKADLVDALRDEFEIALATKAIERDLPLLGICRGMQVLGVACGGALHQHIENHQFPQERHLTKHTVHLNDNTQLYNIINKTELQVNSIHHQVVSVLPTFVTISAVSEDGLIEAIELSNKRFIIGVQWHPEALFDTNDLQQNIFKTFIERATPIEANV